MADRCHRWRAAATAPLLLEAHPALGLIASTADPPALAAAADSAGPLRAIGSELVLQFLGVHTAMAGAGVTGDWGDEQSAADQAQGGSASAADGPLRHAHGSQRRGRWETAA